MNWLSISGKASNLNRLSRTRSTSPSAQFSIRAILSRVYVQLDARPIEKGYREIVCSWKSSGLESAEQCERKSIKSHPRPRFRRTRTALHDRAKIVECHEDRLNAIDEIWPIP